MSADNEQTTQDSQERARNLKFQPGDLIVGRYEYICELDRYGAGGVVCLCRDTNAGGTAMALKTMPDVLRQNAAESAAIQSMFKKVYALNHEGIAAIRSLVEDEFRQYVVMDYVSGLTLGAYMKDHPRLMPAVVEEIVKRLASALDYAHGRGMIHRNVKPGNVMVDIDDHGIVRGVKILDFGLGQQIRESVARATGTEEEEIAHDYFSPEQWRGDKLDDASDQYSLAVLAYEMLAGRRPFKGADMDALKKAVLEGVPKEIRTVPKEMNVALLKALSVKPSDRYASCGDFAQVFSGEKKTVTKRRKGGLAKWLAVAGVAVIAVVAAVLFMNGKKEEEDSGQVVQEVSRPVVSASKTEQTPPPVEEEEPEPSQEVDVNLNPEQAKQKQETLLLRSSLRRMQKTLGEQNLDRGQTFGKRLDAFTDQMNAGNVALKNKDYAVAKLCFETARVEYDWLEAAIGPRREAKAKLADVQEFIFKGEKENAKQYAKDANAKAEEIFAEGRKAFEMGEFTKAVGLLESSQKAFEAVFAEARQNHLAELVEEAKRAEITGTKDDWRKILKLAKEMETLDAEAARGWKEKVDVHLPPTLRLVATVDGKEVPAMLDGTDQKTPWTSSILKSGQKVSHYLIWWKGNEEYIGEINDTVDWNGRMDKTVVLWKKVLNLREGWLKLPRGVMMELVKVEKGTFEMGGAKNSNERPRTVTITRDYWIGKYEVSQDQWNAMEIKKKDACAWEGAKFPVENVSWHEAMAFCEQLNQLAKGLLPAGYHFTLPTEAEWEFAARGGIRSCGYEYSGGNNLRPIGWYWSNSSQRTHPVKGGKKGKIPNELGLYSMSGNVLEWCRDSCEYDEKNLRIVPNPALEAIQNDPLCRKGAYRVVRGGSWQSSEGICRSAYRESRMSDTRYDYLGFRVALSPVR